MPILMNPDQGHAVRPLSAPSSGLAALSGVLGALFVAISGSDILLAWIPFDFGNPEWEFGTISASFNGMLSATLGVALVMVWLRESRHRRALAALAVLMLATGAVMLAATALYWLSVPLALNAVSDGPIQTGLQKAVTKTTLQGVAYPVAYAVMAWLALRWRQELTDS